MRVVRQQGILEYLVARDGLFTIQNIFSLLQFLDFFNISGIKGFEDLQSCIEHHVKEKPTWQLLKPRVRKMAENKEVLHSFSVISIGIGVSYSHNKC